VAIRFFSHLNLGGGLFGKCPDGDAPMVSQDISNKRVFGILRLNHHQNAALLYAFHVDVRLLFRYAETDQCAYEASIRGPDSGPRDRGAQHASPGANGQRRADSGNDDGARAGQQADEAAQSRTTHCSGPGASHSSLFSAGAENVFYRISLSQESDLITG